MAHNKYESDQLLVINYIRIEIFVRYFNYLLFH